MQATIPTQRRQLSSPLLESHVEMIDVAIHSLIDKLSKITPSVSAALFVKDEQYGHEASTVSVVSTPHIHSENLEFINSSIRSHRVDLTATTLGKTFSSHESKLEISRMNPKGHLTWGVYFEPRPNHAAVLQVAFDRNFSDSLDEQAVALIVRKQLKNIWPTTTLLVDEGIKNASLGDELMLNVPVTPNVYAIKWDIVGSTKMVGAEYSLFRHYLQQFTHATVNLATKYDAQITSYQGDSQDIIFTIPRHIDRANLRHIGEFGQEVVLPFTHNLTILHRHIASRYPKINPKIRMAIGLGYVEQLQTGQVTGPVFWEIAALLDNRRGDTSEVKFNQAAKIILNYSPSSTNLFANLSTTSL